MATNLLEFKFDRKVILLSETIEFILAATVVSIYTREVLQIVRNCEIINFRLIKQINKINLALPGHPFRGSNFTTEQKIEVDGENILCSAHRALSKFTLTRLDKFWNWTLATDFKGGLKML